MSKQILPIRRFSMTDKNMHCLDVSILDKKEDTGCFLVKTENYNMLFDCGPESQFDKLCRQLADLGLKAEDITHVFPTHIHLDHAGAAWRFAELNAKIYLHPFGAKHFIDCSKFYESARQIYRERMVEFWGELRALDPDKVVVLEDGQEVKVDDRVVIAHYTPGHAKHHVTLQLEDGLFVGDAMGCIVKGGPIVVATPPPDIDYDLWEDSLQKMKNLAPKTFHFTHYGDFEANDLIFAQVRSGLKFLRELGKKLYNEGYKMDQFYHSLPPEIDRLYRDFLGNTMHYDHYEMMAPSWMNCQGALYHWQSKNKA